ncbi:four helix bundle protein [Hymenobacter ruricola]|uniref:four helix bundle protein n=1 Tax=Hymenobacter ruricola TaxID=2791023 RepID=UPI0021D3328A|nr:four helix bundle protein [Hymenobacter ruricola]
MEPFQTPICLLKFQLLIKECLETKYWLQLLHDTDFITPKLFESMFADADELGKMLFTTIRSTRQLRNSI